MKNSRTALNGRSVYSIALKNGVSAVALAALAAALAMPAMAQDAPAEDSDVTEVVVTGQRAQIKTAQKIKRDAEVVVDSITAVDIGALPDRSVSEALQRVAGLQIQRASEARDPIRMTAEGGGVVIRGLTWVRSETNGRDIFSAKNGRSLSFEDVSADLLAGVDVYKNPAADMIEGGIGGTVNLRTRLPFDSRKRIMAFTIDSTYGDLQKDYLTSGSVVYSDRWDTKVGEMGLLLNYSLGNVGNLTNVIAVDRYVNAETAAGDDVLVPNTMGWRTIDWTQKREAVAAAFQWRPNDSLEFTLQAFHSKATPENTEYNVGFYNDSGEMTSLYTESGGVRMPTASAATYGYDSSGTFENGTVYGAGITANTRYGKDVKTTTDIALAAKWYVSDKLTLTGDIQYIKSTAEILSNTAFVQYCTEMVGGSCTVAGKADASIDLRGDLPKISILDSGEDIQANYYWAAAMDHIEDNEAEQKSIRLDGRYDFDDGSWLKSFKFGARTTDRDYITRQSNWNWGALSHQYWGFLSGGVSQPVYLDEAGGWDVGWASSPANANLPAQSELVSFDNFMHGDVPVPGNIWFPSEGLVSSGPQAMYEQLKATETAGWGWSPATLTNQGAAGLNTQNEQTKAVYGLIRFGGNLDSWGGREVDGNIGVRVVKTETDVGESFVTTTAPTSVVSCVDTTQTAGNCAVYNSVIAFGAASFPVSGGTEYTNVLPSLNLRLKYSDQLQFRFAASKAIVRPEMSWLSPYTTLGSSFTTVARTTPDGPDAGSDPDPILDGNGNPTYYVQSYSLTGQGGTADIQPVEANQYDLTAEWYFAPTSSLTLALFRKDMKNYIYVQSIPETYTNNGQTLTFNVNRYVNGSEEGKVEGFEIAYNQFFDFLPGIWSGLGAQANYTRIESSGGRNPVVSISDGNQVSNSNLNDLPLEGMSPDSYNLAVMYEKYGISARLAYNWRSDYLYTTSAANVNRPMWAEAYGQLDGSIFYDITPKFKIGIQGTNLGRDVAYTRVSSDLSRPLETQYYSATKTDRRISLVLRGSF
ncbi:TonB-dependent receptor [Asticcacaulis sp. SL142]|uniref:TonB-dependent receptor n=1 Tax=Asticcacaulis sp. SL142 TaxID=2995155 RepID=UPI00226C6AC2|nr:TonB-dependent receptor [Asticcacaulis sp. SL142]WAC49852.1 TonB-dependent receptor [Asticcacaulis sp. SL142]